MLLLFNQIQQMGTEITVMQEELKTYLKQSQHFDEACA